MARKDFHIYTNDPDVISKIDNYALYGFMYIICTQQETPVFMRDFRKTPKIDVICSFFVLRSADFLMYIICTRRFFDLSILIFRIFHFSIFDFCKNPKIHFFNFPKLDFSNFRFSIFSNFKNHDKIFSENPERS